MKVHGLTRDGAELLKDTKNVGAVSTVDLSKEEDEVISEEEMMGKGREFLETEMPYHRPRSAFREIILESLSMQRTKEEGERGSPCLKPLRGEKLGRGSPSHIRDTTHDEMNPIRV